MIDEKYTEYAHKVLNGDILAGELVKLACKRFLSWFERDDLEFVPEKADRVVNFCHHLKMSTGKFAGKYMRLTEWQKFVIYFVYGFCHKDTGYRVIRQCYLQLARKSGKALAIDTPIPTPTGYTTMGDLKVGDYVFDDTGQPTQVTYVTPTMYDHKCYEVTFSDGEVITCDADHNWYVDRYHKHKYHVETTQNIVDKGYCNARKDGYKECYVSIPLAQPIQYKERELPIDPYTFGVWLGDGCKNSAKLTLNGDDCMEILSYIPYKPKIVEKYKDENAYDVNFRNGTGEKLSDFSKFLIDYKIKGNKHIPQEFLYNSIENRLALLQGILDTDGYVQKNKLNGSVNCEITQKNNDIADGICFLLNSFGIKYNRRKKIPKLNGKECDEVNRISFNVDKTTPVFRLKRKLNLLADKKGKKDVKHIKSIKEVESVPVKCITVDSPSHLYLCGKRNTITHNTALASALALYHLISDGENDAQVIFAANSTAQATLAFTMAHNYISSLDPKGKIFKKYRDSIKFPKTKSIIKVVSADANRLDGLNVSMAVIDEYHAATSNAVSDVLESSVGMREQPLIVYITSAGFDMESPCYEMRNICVQILNNKLQDDTMGAFIFEMDEDDDIEDPKNWIKCQPNLDLTVTTEYIQQQLQKAKNNPSLFINFKTKILNYWCASAVGEWIPHDYIVKCTNKVDLKDKQFEGLYGILGLDLSSVSDMTALSLMIELDGKFYFKLWYFLPESALKESSNREKYKGWFHKGYLHLTPGNVIDYQYVFDKIMEINQIIPIDTISYDSWQSTALIIKLTEEGFNCQPYSQSMGSMNRPTKYLETIARNGQLIIDDNPITKWMFSNVVIKSDYNGNAKPIKANHSSEFKIDGIVASLNALGMYLSQPQYNNEIFGFQVE